MIIIQHTPFESSDQVSWDGEADLDPRTIHAANLGRTVGSILRSNALDRNPGLACQAVRVLASDPNCPFYEGSDQLQHFVDYALAAATTEPRRVTA